jgi:hypothetical protein
MMQVKLGLTQKEMMNTPWISLIMATNDFPYYQYKKGDKDVITDPKKTANALEKYIKR